MKLEINIKQFYNFGIICFFIIALMNTLNLIRIWNNLYLFPKISSIASICFNIVLMLFFNYLKGTLPKINDEDMPEENKLEDYLDNLK